MSCGQTWYRWRSHRLLRSQFLSLTLRKLGERVLERLRILSDDHIQISCDHAPTQLSSRRAHHCLSWKKEVILLVK